MKFHRLLGFEKEGPGRNFSPAFEKSLEGSILDGPDEEIDKKDRSPDEVDCQGDSSGSYLLWQESAVYDDHHKSDIRLGCRAKPVSDQPNDIGSFQPNADQPIDDQGAQHNEVPVTVGSFSKGIGMLKEEGIGPYPGNPVVDGELRVEEGKDDDDPEEGEPNLPISGFEDL